MFGVTRCGTALVTIIGTAPCASRGTALSDSFALRRYHARFEIPSAFQGFGLLRSSAR
jgi:hypothetical protein